MLIRAGRGMKGSGFVPARMPALPGLEISVSSALFQFQSHDPGTRGNGLSKSSPGSMRSIRMLKIIQKIGGMSRTGMPLESLEPCEGKLSGAVLRGVRAG